MNTIPTPSHLRGDRCWHCGRPLEERCIITRGQPPGCDHEPAVYCGLTCYTEAFGAEGRKAEPFAEPKRRIVSRRRALLEGAHALGFTFAPERGGNRWDAYAAPASLAPEGARYLYFGPVAVRYGRTRRESRPIDGWRLERDLLAAAEACGAVARAPRPRPERPVPEPVNWAERLGPLAEGETFEGPLAEHLAGQLLRYAVGQAMFCTSCGSVADFRRAWILRVRPLAVQCDRCKGSAK